VELLLHKKGGSAGFGAKMALSLNGVDPSCMNSITGSTCRAKCSNILHDKTAKDYKIACVNYSLWTFILSDLMKKSIFDKKP
jgi:hypothetical protein